MACKFRPRCARRTRTADDSDTGYPSQELKARAEANVFSFIEKPFSLTEVAGAVRQATFRSARNCPEACSWFPLRGRGQVGARHIAGRRLRRARRRKWLRGQGSLEREPDITVAILDGLSAEIDHEHPGRRVACAAARSDRRRQQRRGRLGTIRRDGNRLVLPRFWETTDCTICWSNRSTIATAAAPELASAAVAVLRDATQFACANCHERIEGVLRADVPDATREQCLRDFVSSEDPGKRARLSSVRSRRRVLIHAARAIAIRRDGRAW